VIVIAFHAADPELAARGANAVADAYLALRRSAVAGAAEALAAEIERLRRVLAEAEARMSALKDEAAGAPSPLTAAERAALVAERDAVRDAARKAEDDAAAIREALRAGNVLSLVPVREDSAVMRLLDEQHSVVEEIAKEMATIPLGNPRVAELRARLSEIDAEIEAAARRMADALAADAEAALARVAEIEQRLDASDVATRRQAEIAALEETVVETRGLLDAALRRQEGTGQNGVVPSDVRLLTRATVPTAPVWPDTMGLTLLAFVAALVLGAVAVVLREFASGRAFREVPFEPLADLEQPAPAAGRFRRIEDEGVPRAMPEEPTLAPAVETSEASLGAVADGVAGRRRIVVALAEGSDSDGRPLAAVALARALSARDRTVVLVDIHADGADSIAMGEAPGLPGFADLLAGDVSFAQVIFRDRRSRAHFIPAGLNPIKAEALSGERLATLLTALDHTYDHVVIDCPDDAISRIAPGADAALVASEHASVDPRTVRAVARIAKVSAARIFHLIVDPARRSPEPEAAAA
ncbi:MAG TPA: hypothetical protein VFK86_01835, partial [Bauldia sp.]|nr:hypothetical protein [Bauldia sp.]